MNSWTTGKKHNKLKDWKKCDLWTNMNTVKEYKVLDDYRIWLRFEDGFDSIIELKQLLNRGIAVELLDPTAFSKVAIESGGGLAWENGFDICPNSLRELAELKEHVV